MFPFKKRLNSTPDSLASSAIKQLIQLLLKRLSNRLSHYEQKMSLCAKKTLITLFCIVAGVLAMSTLYRGLFIPTSTRPNFLTQPAVHVPLNIRIPDSLMYRGAPHGMHKNPVTVPHLDSINK